jgi:hypothetical protein
MPSQSRPRFEVHYEGLDWEYQHELKTWPPYFEAVMHGEKTFDLRPADRDFEVGDYIRFREWDPKTAAYTGREHFQEIIYVLAGEEATPFGLTPGFVALGLGF